MLWSDDGSASAVTAASARAPPWGAALAVANGNGAVNIVIEDRVMSEAMDSGMDKDHDDPSHLIQPMQVLNNRYWGFTAFQAGTTNLPTCNGGRLHSARVSH